jgi:hypothetical protein
MNTLNLTVALSLLASSFALPTLALADTMMDPAKMTCAEFTAMDATGMMAAVDAMHKASPDAAMAMDDAAMKMASDHTMKACEGKADMMAMDAMMMK